MERWGCLIGDNHIDITERLFARAFRISVASAIRWRDLLNTAPSTLALMNEGLIGSAAKTNTLGLSDGSPCEIPLFLILKMISAF